MNRRRILVLTTAVLVVAASFVLGTCNGADPAEPERDLPEGTVMLVDGMPITAAEVDAQVDELSSIMPAYTLTHRRRLGCRFDLSGPVRAGRRLLFGLGAGLIRCGRLLCLLRWPAGFAAPPPLGHRQPARTLLGLLALDHLEQRRSILGLRHVRIPYA